MVKPREDCRVESLRHRLSTADTDLLTAITEGDSALDNFLQQFTTLLQDFENVRSTGLDRDLEELAGNAASRVALYAQVFYEVITEAQAFDIVGEMESIFADLTLSDCHPSPCSSPILYPNCGNPGFETSCTSGKLAECMS